MQFRNKLTPNDDYVAELSGVGKRFGDSIALNGFSLAVTPGELLALLGSNGAGKTTAISIMLGLLEPDTGSVSLFGKSGWDLETRCQIGVMMQEIFLAPELRVREQIDLVASYYPTPLTTDSVMQITGTTSLANRAYGRLSGGQKRQVQFAMAICGQPRLLFLDEPTVGLDVLARQKVWSALRKLVSDGTSILLTTHYLEEAEALADRVVVLAKGRVIASGTINEMRALIVRKRVNCISALDANEVKNWPKVQSASRDLDRLYITTDDAEAVVQKLMVNDPNLRELVVQRADLADIFTQLIEGAE